MDGSKASESKPVTSEKLYVVTDRLLGFRVDYTRKQFWSDFKGSVCSN